MTLRGKTAIVGIGELPSRREWPGRTSLGLMAEAARMAIADAGLKKGDIDGLVTAYMVPGHLAEYMDIRPVFVTGVNVMGMSGTCGTTVAAMAIASGMCTTVLVAAGGGRDSANDAPAPAPEASIGSEFESPFGRAAGAGTTYGLVYRRHMFEYGTKPEQLAKCAADQRFNALTNPNSAFRGQPITVQDVLNSRYINEPLHLLECVMPTAGAVACIVTSAERAKALPNPPVYLLGSGIEQGPFLPWMNNNDICTTPARVSALRARNMAGYRATDMQFAEFYDWYTILVSTCLEDAGLAGMKKGDIGPFYESTDTTYKGTFPINTDGGQLSLGQKIQGGGGFGHVIEATRQLMGRAGDRQVAKHDLCMVNGWGGEPSQMCSLVLGTEATL